MIRKWYTVWDITPGIIVIHFFTIIKIMEYPNKTLNLLYYIDLQIFDGLNGSPTYFLSTMIWME